MAIKRKGNAALAWPKLIVFIAIPDTDADHCAAAVDIDDDPDNLARVSIPLSNYPWKRIAGDLIDEGGLGIIFIANITKHRFFSISPGRRANGSGAFGFGWVRRAGSVLFFDRNPLISLRR